MSAAERLIAEHKALLATRAELDRNRVLLSVYEIRQIIAPVPTSDRVLRMRPAAVLVVALLGPFVGARRLARWLRIASLAIGGLRVARSWKQQ